MASGKNREKTDKTETVKGGATIVDRSGVFLVNPYAPECHPSALPDQY